MPSLARKVFGKTSRACDSNKSRFLYREEKWLIINFEASASIAHVAAYSVVECKVDLARSFNSVS